MKKALPQSAIDLLGSLQDDWHVEAEGGVIVFYLMNELWDSDIKIDGRMEALVQITKTLEG